MKNTVALAWRDRVVLSPHIGDMDTPRSLDVFAQTVTDLQCLYGVQVAEVVCDAHPGYATSRWAARCGLPVMQVYHHHAHAAALAGEALRADPWLIFAWDGVGLGEDGTLWGGEALLGVPGRWRRAATMRSFRLPGGEKAGREPWRSAAALCWETGRKWGGEERQHALLYQAWSRRLNAPVTTAVGRLFDAAAALTGLCRVTSFEAQGPMYLESACTAEGVGLELPVTRHEGLWVTDWEPLLDYLQDNHRGVGEWAMGFHKTMALALVQQALRIRETSGVKQVGLCGGVFQNRILTTLVDQYLQDAGFTVFMPEKIPVNDAGLSYGQVIEYGFRTGAPV